MKKLALTIAIVLTMGLGAFAQDYYYNDNGSMLRKSTNDLLRDGDDPTTPFIPYQHGLEGDVNGETPLGSGIAVLMGLGAAYFVAKKRREE